MKKAQKTKKHRRSRSRFRSKFESDVALSLDREGVTDWEYETLKIKYVKHSQYTPDFILSNGVIIEAKGYMPPQDRTKHILVKQQNPEYDIRFLFQNAYLTLTKTSKTTYAQWAERHGFQWCHKRIPVTWTQS